MRPPILLLATTLLACGDGGTDPEGCSGFVGSMGSAPEIDILVRTVDGSTVPGVEGSRVPLIVPPQGGKVIFVGARAKNLDSCAVQLRGFVRDGSTDTDLIVGLEARTVNLLEGGDGWAHPAEPMQISSYANIPLCPNLSSSRDMYEQPYRLTVRVTDRQNRIVEKSIMVTPFCGEPDGEAECLCTCKESYILGQSCS